MVQRLNIVECPLVGIRCGSYWPDLASTPTPYINDQILECISRTFFILYSGIV